MDSSDIARSFQPYLLPGERIRWSGRPKQGLVFGPGDTLLVPFSLMWGGFAIFWNAMVWFGPFAGQQEPNIFFRLWGLPFLAIGLYLIVGRFFHDAWLRKGRRYAVTDQRVLFLQGAKFTALDIGRLPRLEMTEHRDGTGTIDLGIDRGLFAQANGFDWWLTAAGKADRLFRIPDPRGVYRLLRSPPRG
ncbi:hypothetical protein [Sphingomonas sp. VNH70]|uniref:hypothetical protein n=1 Tax=Sphingomonas silueang TaxID=3156617 RepID=UPI0032B50078